MTAELPTGTVTFLFTDIEGSTRLLHELGDAYADVLGEHRRILRNAFAEHGGVEVDTQGDAFFVAFARATDAAAAAADAQRDLADGLVRVRIGIHTGEPIRTGEGYVGIDVHRAARIAAVGHGGQVLVSQTSRDLLDARGDLLDLGEHRLKDLTEAQRIFQLGDGEFPPLKSLNRTNLPVARTTLVGREQELAELRGLLGNGTRLVTVTGAGGSGKTRLALQVAAELSDDFDDGVFFVSFAAIQDVELVAPTIEQAVGLRELAELRDSETLLVLDNMEHLLPAAGVVSSLLGEAPNVKLLATSRAPLRVSGEHEYALDPLRQGEAVELFLERARAAKHDVAYDDAIPEICRRLDGLPLALELAASRVKVLDPTLLLERLEQRLPLLTGGARDAPERQQTLRATIEWSYELLDETERQLFSRMAVFAGTFDLEAAERVCDADLDGLQSLIDNSLVRQTDGSRFIMLETIREYAGEKLAESTDPEATRECHATYFEGLVLKVSIRGGSEMDSDDLVRLIAEQDNLRAALDWIESSGDHERFAALVGTVWSLWYYQGQFVEGRRRLETALARGDHVQLRDRSRLLAGLSNITLRQGDTTMAEDAARQELVVAEAVRDGTALSLAHRDIGNALLGKGDVDGAVGYYERSASAAKAAGDADSLAIALLNVAHVELTRGENERACSLLDDLLSRELPGSDPKLSAVTHFNYGLALLGLQRNGEAEREFSLALEITAPIGWIEGLLYPLIALAAVAARRAAFERAARLTGAADRLRETLGNSPLLSVEREIYERTVVECRAVLGETAFASAHAEGHGMTTEETVGYALSSLD